MKIWLTILFILGVGVRSALGCELALVVALDVSRSVDKFEYRLMRNGIGAAFLDQDVVDVISALPGGIMVTVTQWGGVDQQRQAIGWQHLEDLESTLNFVETFTQIDRGYWMADTSVSGALLHAELLLQSPQARCRRKVIDVSGDGISNSGPDVSQIALTVERRGITINGLIISGAKPDPVTYFVTQVIGGPGAFVEVADSYQNYEQAMKRKLLRELTPNLSLNRITGQAKYSYLTDID